MRPIEPPSRTSDCAIVLCADRKFFAPAYAVCMSLVLQQPERNDIYLLTEEGVHLQKVPTDVPFNVMTPEFVSRLPNIPELWQPLTPFAFLRLLLTDVIPGYRRILYLDSDIRVDGSVAPLFKLDMKGTTIAAVDDVISYFELPMIKIKSKMAPAKNSCMALGLGCQEVSLQLGRSFGRLRTVDAWSNDERCYRLHDPPRGFSEPL